MNKLIHYYYDTSKSVSDPATIRRIHLLIISVIGMSALFVISVVFAFFQAQYIQLSIIAFYILIYFCPLYILKKYQMLEVALKIFCYSLLFFIIVTIFCLAENAHIVTFWTWLPVSIAGFLIGKTEAVKYSIILVVAVILLKLLNLSGYRFPYAYNLPEKMLVPYISSIIIHFIVIAYFAWYFESTREQAEVQMKKNETGLLAVQKELVEISHQAGMAEIASGTLENIEKILSRIKSVNDDIRINSKQSKISDFMNANEQIRKNRENINDFFSQGPEGKMILNRFLEIEEAVLDENNTMIDQLSSLINTVDIMAENISTQQKIAVSGDEAENIRLNDIIQDILFIQPVAKYNNHISIHKHFITNPTIKAQKAKLVHVLVNLLKTVSDESVEENEDKKELLFTVNSDASAAYVKVSYTGKKIPENELTNIFSHDLKTDESTPGFGLATCAEYIKEMGGSMWAESEGYGTTFILKFPFV